MQEDNVAKVIYSYLILCFTYSSLYGQMRYGDFIISDYVIMPLGWLFSAVIFYFFIKVVFKIFTVDVWLDRIEYIKIGFSQLKAN